MPYSFSEDHDKSIRILSIDGRGITSEIVKSPAGRKVATIEGPLSDVLLSDKFRVHERSFVRVRITDPGLQIGAMAKVRARFPHALELEQTALTAQGQLTAESLRKLSARGEEEVVHQYTEETWPNGFDEFERAFVNSAVAATFTREPS